VSQAQQLPTSGIVTSRLGKIELKNGYPTDETAKKIYDDLFFNAPARLTSGRCR
jgi:hypothetical protein